MTTTVHPTSQASPLQRGLFLFFVCTLLIAAAPSARAQLSTNSASITTLVGRVSVERSGELWTLNAGSSLEPGQVVVTGTDGYAELMLPDGSQLEVFSNSRFVYRSNRFSLRDLLDVYIGKIRLHIQHLTNDDDPPLRITSPTAVISVRGTVFDVEVDPAQETLVSVETGTVSVRHRMMPGREVFVETGQTLRVSSNVPLAAVVKGRIKLGTVGRVIQAVGDTVAGIRAARSAGGHGSSGGSSGSGSSGASGPSGPSDSDAGSNEPVPPPGEDDGSGSSNGSGGSSSAPPGDVIP